MWGCKCCTIAGLLASGKHLNVDLDAWCEVNTKFFSALVDWGGMNIGKMPNSQALLVRCLIVYTCIGLLVWKRILYWQCITKGYS